MEPWRHFSADNIPPGGASQGYEGRQNFPEEFNMHVLVILIIVLLIALCFRREATR